MEEFEELFSFCCGAFRQLRTYSRALEFAKGIIVCIKRPTVSGVVTACGQQFKDWTAYYRLFSNERIDIRELFSIIRKKAVEEQRQVTDAVIAHLDDSMLRKSGRKIPGSSWQRDPLGPAFHTNFIWGQRFIQLSVAMPEGQSPCRSRAIPVDFHHCPPVKKPKASADAQAWEIYRAAKRKLKLSQVGVERICKLRADLNQDGRSLSRLIVSVDGSYTNETVIKHLPQNTTLIGRVRKDCRLNKIPDLGPSGAGRKRVYGQPLPSPEQIRQSKEYPWQQVEAWAAGKAHTFNVKILRELRWHKAGKMDLQLMIIKPLGYRLTKASKLLYRQPAYLICSDGQLDTATFLQTYLWRWEIEVNFRDEKNLLGCGKAQVRNQHSAESVPAFFVAIYALLLLAALRIGRKNKASPQLPRPKWYPRKSNHRPTTGDLINLARGQMWAKEANINFSHFVALQQLCKNRKNSVNPTLSAAIYARS
jgi:hypothetical protein